MSDRLPIDANARDRLREAQRNEVEALKTVSFAERAHHGAVARVEQTQSDLDAAYAALVEVSGETRAARLTGVTVKTLRRVTRNGARNRTHSE